MSAVLVFSYDCGFEVSIPASPVQRRELVSLLEAIADERHDRFCETCQVSHPQRLSSTDQSD